ncbi:pyridoxamine 5'-phosphate oxidase family protein [Nocardioides szechwanensis]|uniref:pyridoxamine 5'-phosphate oxidase family protein n=1 Tax=Nocardioides szechwanensis TaxID=1005944 RepID=UPI0014795029|nr:pyridoxamine 5'-phosphate oxidase family protein [Nocardioides szechwanensis]
MSIAASRRENAETLLRTHRDLWLATSSDSGPHLVPLSFVWPSERLLFATSATSRTGRNVLESGLARAAIGATRDLVIVVGSVSPVDADDKGLLLAFAERLGFGPSDVGDGGTLFSLAPREIQTWIERADPDRWLMRHGHWVT